MILSFGNKATERIWAGEHMSKFPLEIRELARRKLRMLHASKSIGDLVLPPSNRLEKLKGNLKNIIPSGSISNGESFLSGSMVTQKVLK